MTIGPYQIKRLADSLTDPNRPDDERLPAGDRLANSLSLGASPSLRHIKSVVLAVARGMRQYENARRIPARPNDFVFEDLGLLRVHDVLATASYRLKEMSDRSLDPQEQSVVASMISSNGLDTIYDQVSIALDGKNLLETIDEMQVIASTAKGLQSPDNDPTYGQTIKLDIPMYVVSQYLEAVADRLEKLTSYSLPDDC